jgi:multidrug resistance efflux pump
LLYRLSQARYQDEVRNADAKVGEALLETESLQRQLGQMKLERDQVEIKLKAVIPLSFSSSLQSTH